MKKLLSALAAAVLVPFSAFAISVSDITSNPDQFEKIADGRLGTVYLDVNSIESLRYDPPYYTMRGTAYAVSYSSNLILGFTETADYDYNQSLESLAKKLAKDNYQYGWNKSSSQLYSMAENSLRQNSGITCSWTNITGWDLDGNYQSSPSSFAGRKAEYEKLPWLVAQSLFSHYYNQPF